MQFHNGQIQRGGDDFSWIVYDIPSSSESCSVRFCFLWLDVEYCSYIGGFYLFIFVFVEYKLYGVSSCMQFLSLWQVANFIAH